jgi:hypothetical protein
VGSVRSCEPERGRQSPRAVDWYDSAEVAAERMALWDVQELEVRDGAGVIGHVSADDIDRLALCGTWPGSVCVRDIMHPEGRPAG